MKTEKFKGLEDLPSLLIGNSITLTDSTADEVREELKSNPLYSGVGNRVIDVGNSIVVVVRTKGRVSKMKESFIEKVKEMHPFERLLVPGVRLEYARSVLKEFNEDNGTNVQVREFEPSSDTQEGIIELFQDVFESESIHQNWTTEELVQSFITNLYKWGHPVESVSKAINPHIMFGEGEDVSEVEEK